MEKVTLSAIDKIYDLKSIYQPLSFQSIVYRASVLYNSSGMDYFGPHYCKDLHEDSEIFKYFIVLYTCASERVIILDLVADCWNQAL